jgi:hypothetical protein
MKGIAHSKIVEKIVNDFVLFRNRLPSSHLSEYLVFCGLSNPSESIRSPQRKQTLYCGKPCEKNSGKII